MQNGKKISLFFLCIFLICSLASCGVKNYSGTKEYKKLFLNTDTADETDIKNHVIQMIEYYNDGKYQKYISFFDREKSDRKTFVNDQNEIAKTMKQTYEIGSIDVAILDADPNQAQAGVVLIISITDVNSGSIKEKYKVNMVYTMSRDSGKWLVTKDEMDQTTIDYLIEDGEEVVSDPVDNTSKTT